jgi:hypothetical protein
MLQDTAATRGIPLETPIPLLPQHCLDPQATGILERNENFRALKFRCHHMFYLNDFM